MGMLEDMGDDTYQSRAERYRQIADILQKENEELIEEVHELKKS